MSFGVCFIAAGLPVPSKIDELLKQCGLDVWTPQLADESGGHIYAGALCMVIDMPREAGFRTFRLFRSHGVQTPVLLIVDPGLETALQDMDPEWGLDAVARDAPPREILGRLEALCRKRRQHQQPEHISAL